MYLEIIYIYLVIRARILLVRYQYFVNKAYYDIHKN